MATQSVTQDATVKETVRKALRIELIMWGLNQELGKVDGSTNSEPMPSLNENEIDAIAAKVERAFQHIICGERAAPRRVDALATAQNVARFPKQKKRGAKVRKGPCAAILAFRGCSPDRLTGEDLLSEWAWIRKHHADWDDEELTGRVEEREWQSLFREQAVRAAIKGQAIPDGDAIRREIAEHRATIEKRVRTKDWLETRGVDWDEVNTPEKALFFIFDRLQGSEQPASA